MVFFRLDKKLEHSRGPLKVSRVVVAAPTVADARVARPQAPESPPGSRASARPPLRRLGRARGLRPADTAWPPARAGRSPSLEVASPLPSGGPRSPPPALRRGDARAPAPFPWEGGGPTTWRSDCPPCAAEGAPSGRRAGGWARGSPGAPPPWPFGEFWISVEDSMRARALSRQLPPRNVPVAPPSCSWPEPTSLFVHSFFGSVHICWGHTPPGIVLGLGYRGHRQWSLLPRKRSLPSGSSSKFPQTATFCEGPPSRLRPFPRTCC